MATKYLSSSSYPSQQRDPGQCRGAFLPVLVPLPGDGNLRWAARCRVASFADFTQLSGAGVILFLCQSDMGRLVLVTGNQGLGTSELLS